MATYYIDWKNGNNENDGLTENTPKKSHEGIELVPNDTVLFKRGNMLRDHLKITSGNENGRITYGAYGEGANPAFSGSVDVSDKSLWEKHEENIWKYTGNIGYRPCNFIFNFGTHCGNLRWKYEDLQNQGEWYDAKSNEDFPEGTKRELYMYSVKNPAEYYNHIEYVTRKYFALATGTYYNINDLTFMNNGVHGATGPHDITMRRCQFLYLGGCVWSREQRIRFGNAVEAWMYPKNVSVEYCLFNNIYDSCITHQGFDGCVPAVNMDYSHNLLMNYGMAAYEVRDHIPTSAKFNDNICIGAGLGFAPQGEKAPRRSEIWPFPMGHHVFLWRILEANPHCESFEIKRNIFHDAPFGAAIYSFIMENPEKQIDLDDNTYYTTNKKLINRFGEVNYTPDEFSRYVCETGKDKHSVYEKTDIRAKVKEWFKEAQISDYKEVSDELLSSFGI